MRSQVIEARFAAEGSQPVASTRRRRRRTSSTLFLSVLLLQFLIYCAHNLPHVSAFQFSWISRHRRLSTKTPRFARSQRKRRRNPQKNKSGTYRSQFLLDNGLEIVSGDDGTVTARSSAQVNKETSANNKHRQPITELPAKPVPPTGFNVVLTHATADFDSLASAVGLAKLWSTEDDEVVASSAQRQNKTFDSASDVPTFVVLPRGAHPGVQRFLGLHKHLFPIRSLKSLPDDLSGLNRLALVDAQRRDRLGPADSLLKHANRITVVDHHIDQDSDIPATDYVVDKVGSVSTLITERLQQAGVEVTEVEATLLALGIHADTGSLSFDSTTPRDAHALAWCLTQGASQAAIAEHMHSSLSSEQQNVLTQALINANMTKVHGVTLATCLLSADGFINGLAAVTQDALELSSSDIFLLAVVYEAQGGSSRGGRRKRKQVQTTLLTSRLLTKTKEQARPGGAGEFSPENWMGGEIALRRRRLRASFDRKDKDQSGYLEEDEIAAALASSGVIASPDTVTNLMSKIDKDGDGRIDFDEFVAFATDAEEILEKENAESGRKSSTTMIVIGRVKAGVNLKGVRLHKLLEEFGGGGHAKAASATVRLNDESEAVDVLEGLVDTLIETSLSEQSTVGDFMTSPVLSVQEIMTEKQVEDLFTRYDVRALPVVDEDNDVIGLVTYKEVAAAKQRLWNKEQKRLRREADLVKKGKTVPEPDAKLIEARKKGTAVKAWMLQHVTVVEASTTMAEAEIILLQNDVGCIPVVANGTKQLVGMVTRTDLLRQHQYYPSLHYHNKGFVNSIAARKPIIELRRRLKQFDIEDE